MTPCDKTKPPASEARRLRNWQAAVNRLTVILLLFTVAGLFTLAKTGQYYPTSNPAQHISVSIKMNVVHSSLEAAEEPLQPVIRFLLSQPPVGPRLIQSDEPSPVVPVGVTVSMQHRSPPYVLA
jgi:hypothetical protein